MVLFQMASFVEKDQVSADIHVCVRETLSMNRAPRSGFTKITVLEKSRLRIKEVVFIQVFSGEKSFV